MTRSSNFILLSAAILFIPSSLQADHPINKNLTYSIHDNPSDPETPVVFIVELDLRAADADGDDVGWEVKQARFKKLDGQQVVKEWFINWPTFDTTDGLWWISHDDAVNPKLAEFGIPPLLAGTAQRKNASGPGLEYEMEGEAYTPPQGGPPYPMTSSLTYIFQEVGGSTPEESGEEEPVAVDENEEGPGS